MSSPYRVLGLTVFPLLRWRIRKLSGLENLPSSGGFIVVANHQSWIDSGMIAGALYQNIPASLRAIAQSSKYRWLGGIPIDEYDKSRVLDIAYGYLQAGHPIVIFPEGNSNKNPELRSGKTGAARLALHSGLPVIPVGIQGTEGIKGWQALGWFAQFWKPCRVNIGRPLTFPKTDMTGVNHDHLMIVTDQIMQQISHYSGKPYMPSPDTRLQERTAHWLKRFLRTVAISWLSRRLRLRGAEHLPPHGPYIIAANHVSYFDPIALSAVVWRERKVQPYFLTKGSIAGKWRTILGSAAFDIFGMLPVDKKNPGLVIQPAVDHVRAGGVIGIFPEGSRNKAELNPEWKTAMMKGKTGLARLWLATKVSVIPAGIQAPQGVSLYRTLLNAFRWWQPITITFSASINFPPMPPGEPSKKDLEDVTRVVMKRIGAIVGLAYPY